MAAMLLDVDAAFARLRRLVRPIADSEEVALADAVGRVAAADVRAPVHLPPFDGSAMDGYAVASAGHDNSRLKQFAVVDRSLAGRPARRAVGESSAIRIFTGAPLPLGADAVVLQEDVAVLADGAQIETREPVRSEQHVRRRGHDIRRGDTLLTAGRKLRAFDLAWLAACGIERLRVVRRPRAAVFSTGDELAAPGQPLKPGQIYESNRFSLVCLLGENQVDAVDLGNVPDDAQAIRQALQVAAEQADLVVTSGGVSVGEADLVRDVVSDIGALDFWRIALKPGKPLAVGQIGNALFFGLPGNPASTIITYLLFVAPAAELLAGGDPPPPLALPATMREAVRHTIGRREYLRGVATLEAGGLGVVTTGDQGSNRLATFSGANCLIVVDAETGDLEPGDSVRVVLLSGSADHLLPAAQGLPPGG